MDAATTKSRSVLHRALSHMLRGAADELADAANRLYEPPPPPPSAEEVRQREWHAVRGDETLRLDYDLDASSIVFDLGGYKGQWASDIFARYASQIYVFEPVGAFAVRIQKRFERNPRILVHPFGLASADGVVTIAVTESDWSSIHRVGADGTRSEECKLVRASEFLNNGGFDRIDLMKMNIEGAEYDLLEHLVESGLVTRIGNIQVQFHDFVTDAATRMRTIQDALERTHRLTYQFPYVWENWQRRA